MNNIEKFQQHRDAVSDLYTHVGTSELDHAFGKGWMSYGRTERAEIISQARAHFQRQLEEAQAFLDTPDDQLQVRIYRGFWRPQLVEELKP